MNPLIPWSHLTVFMRQHLHDVGNELNVLALETELLPDLVTDNPEADAAARRINQQAHHLSAQLRALTQHFQAPQPDPDPTSARLLLLLWQEQHAALPHPPTIHWQDELADEKVLVDAQMMARVFQELSRNASAFPASGPLTLTARASAGQIHFELQEPKAEPLDLTHWTTPFYTTRPTHYGLGLYTARRRAEANGATWRQSGNLLTEIILPQL